MDEFYFHCPFCSKEIKAYTDMIGKIGECPGCGNDITIPYPNRKRNPEKSQPENKSENNKDKERCPYCDNPVKPGTTACPHCTHTFYSTNKTTNIIMYVVWFVVIYFLLTAFCDCEAQRVMSSLSL